MSITEKAKGSDNINIYLNIYNQLIKSPEVPPETGGILGGKNSIVDTIFFDNGKKGSKGIKYIPNIDLINKCIEQWVYKGVEFLGIFHTHSTAWGSLSNGDKKYIEIIMAVMPESIQCLFFPIVFPNECIKSFRAEKKSQKIYIVKDDIKIIR